MNSKKIFILAYTRQNLGDDLFVYMLLKKYPNTQFYINIEKDEYARLFEKFSNITVYKEPARNLKKENADEYDGYIYIAGSIFMEGIGSNYIITEQFLDFLKECKKKEIPFHYVSSNFGPYYTEEYLKLAKKVFENCTSICFRDNYSKKLFQEIPTVHYAPDLVFSYIPEKTEKKLNSVGFSLIDLSIRKKIVKYKEQYYQMLEKNIREYIMEGKNITLFSFCKYEGDERAIEEFMSKLPSNLRDQINIINYDGDIEYFLREYSKMEYMVCSRFHSMVLSSIMNQRCEIISYSDKIDNVINDLNLFTGNIVHFDEIDANTKMSLINFQKVENEKLQSITKKAITQLAQVDKSLK